eukprot:PhF_6_TR31730/c0_g1_i1/m.46699/K06950/K06950; uncharacterized protein
MTPYDSRRSSTMWTTKKFFPTHTNYENARLVLNSCITDMRHTELILKMISLVSTRTHGNSAGDVKADEMWMLYPRFADRLEAIGEVGIQRALVYNDHVQTPMYTDASPMPITEAELSQVASSERFEGYMMSRTPSDSFIDHFYDKLLHIGKPEAFAGCTNPYLLKEAESRHQVLVDFVLKHNRERA